MFQQVMKTSRRNELKERQFCISVFTHTWRSNRSAGANNFSGRKAWFYMFVKNQEPLSPLFHITQISGCFLCRVIKYGYEIIFSVLFLAVTLNNAKTSVCSSNCFAKQHAKLCKS